MAGDIEKDIDWWLGAVSVYEPYVWDNIDGPKDWYAVATVEQGIIAYFHSVVDAYRFRLDYINRQMNP